MIGGIKKMAFKNKKDRFASLLHDIAVNLHEGANFFATYNINSVEDLHTFSNKIKEYELPIIHLLSNSGTCQINVSPKLLSQIKKGLI